jgi:thiol-disulfide isomerase/thioredoxin
MAPIVLLARLILAAIFLLAAVAKLRDRARSRDALREFGLPAALARPAAVLLPLAELAVAILLLPAAAARAAAAAALGLLCVFTAAIAVQLARGRKPDCRCFGELRSSPIGPRTLARNAAFAALAGLVLLHPPAPLALPLRRAADPVGSIVVASLALALLACCGLAWLCLRLWQQQGRLLLRIEALEAARGNQAAARRISEVVHGLPVGAAAPDFSLPDPDGGTVTLAAARARGKPVLLVFTDPSCGPCAKLAPELARWQREHADVVSILAIGRAGGEGEAAKRNGNGGPRLLLQRGSEVEELYRVRGTPTAVAVTTDGRIGAEAATGVRAIRELALGLVEGRVSL